MKYSIVPLQEKHLEDAARLVIQRYTHLRMQLPLLPEKYSQIDVLLPMLANVLKAGNSTAAICDSRLVGFLSSYRLGEFLGMPSAFSPEWANAAEMEDSRRIYEELYSVQAGIWVDEGYPSHLISMLVNDQAGLQGWHWLGFGHIAADAIRSLEPVPESDLASTLRRATPDDIEIIMMLDRAFLDYLSGSPTFYPHGADRDRAFYMNWLQNPTNAVWLAYQDAEPAAYMVFGPASHEACTIIVDGGTTSITGAFTSANARRQGIAAALLNSGLEWARQNGFQRCAVDFEPTNPLAARFWTRHFQLACLTLMRQINI